MQIEVETVDRTGTFLGSLWESRQNVAISLLEAGLAKLQPSFGSDRIPDAHLLEQAEQSAKRQKLKVRSRTRCECRALVSEFLIHFFLFLFRSGKTMLRERKSPKTIQLLKANKRKC